MIIAEAATTVVTWPQMATCLRQRLKPNSFSLANMVPQDPCNNEVLWEGIELAVRDLTLSEGEVFVVTGPVFRGAELRILNGRVLIPTHLYKAIYVPSRNIAGAYFAPNDASQKWEALDYR